ncbi:MAG: TIGR01777 family oxidoreductase [Myxococcota bacterium]
MKITITGGTGLVGGALRSALAARGDAVTVVSRTAGPGRVTWDAERGLHDPAALSGQDAVVHLAGAGVADKRWSAARKREILDSRIWTTRAVVEALARADPKPKTFVCASAVGYYGAAGDRLCPEDAPPGDDFLAEVCVAWEREAAKVDPAIRPVTLRIGLVMSPQGGALARMLPAFRCGGGGVLGSGDQYMPWIHLDDAIAGIVHLLDHDDARGAFNLTAPNPVDNRTFTKALGRALSRPTFMRVPAFGLRALFGELSTALLGGQRAVPERLRETGFVFAHPQLDPALADLLRTAS